MIQELLSDSIDKINVIYSILLSLTRLLNSILEIIPLKIIFILFFIVLFLLFLNSLSPNTSKWNYSISILFAFFLKFYLNYKLNKDFEILESTFFILLLFSPIILIKILKVLFSFFKNKISHQKRKNFQSLEANIEFTQKYYRNLVSCIYADLSKSQLNKKEILESIILLEDSLKELKKYYTN